MKLQLMKRIMTTTLAIAIIGSGLVLAALTVNSSNAPGTMMAVAPSFRTLAHQANGSVVDSTNRSIVDSWNRHDGGPVG